MSDDPMAKLGPAARERLQLGFHEFELMAAQIVDLVETATKLPYAEGITWMAETPAMASVHEWLQAQLAEYGGIAQEIVRHLAARDGGNT